LAKLVEKWFTTAFALMAGIISHRHKTYFRFVLSRRHPDEAPQWRGIVWFR